MTPKKINVGYTFGSWSLISTYLLAPRPCPSPNFSRRSLVSGALHQWFHNTHGTYHLTTREPLSALTTLLALIPNTTHNRQQPRDIKEHMANLDQTEPKKGLSATAYCGRGTSASPS